MMSIWKFPLAVVDDQIIEMPRGQFLTIATQGGMPQLWALVDTDSKKTKRRLRTYGTGHPVDGDIGAFLGTYQLDGGALVFHVFEVKA
jgi:hypothetical protein